jgi:hypothetical protein
MNLILFQLNEGKKEGIHALENHPVVKRITPHKKVTRSLKYVKGQGIKQYVDIHGFCSVITSSTHQIANY